MAKALGLVETRGLVAAIEAADAMVKAANVTLIGKERTDPALITIKVAGETAAVKSAVDAGAAAAGRVGVLVSTHIIPQPDEQIKNLIPEIEEDYKTEKAEKSVQSEDVKKIPETSGDEKRKRVITVLKEQEKKEKAKKAVERNKESEKEETIVTDTISRLRKEALGTEKAEKKESGPSAAVPKVKFKMDELERLNVHQLRRLARDTEGFPIQGRQISMANRGKLLDYFKKLI